MESSLDLTKEAIHNISTAKQKIDKIYRKVTNSLVSDSLLGYAKQGAATHREAAIKKIALALHELEKYRIQEILKELETELSVTITFAAMDDDYTE